MRTVRRVLALSLLLSGSLPAISATGIATPGPIDLRPPGLAQPPAEVRKRRPTVVVPPLPRLRPHREMASPPAAEGQGTVDASSFVEETFPVAAIPLDEAGLDAGDEAALPLLTYPPKVSGETVGSIVAAPADSHPPPEAQTASEAVPPAAVSEAVPPAATVAVAPAAARPAAADPVSGSAAIPQPPQLSEAAPLAEPPIAPDDPLGDPRGGRPIDPADLAADLPFGMDRELSAQPFQMVRTLQMLQDRIAQGSADALLAQRDLRARIDRQFSAAPAEVWQDERNAIAAVTYVLSGGSPGVLVHLAKLSPAPAVDERLIRGVLAYIEGREREADELLAGFDPFALPPSIGAQLALAQSALAVRSDPAKAMALLDVARLLAPGTLVEEAALRREIYVADRVRAFAKVEMLARRYLERFRHSVYAGNFRERFAAAITHMDFVKNPEQLSKLDEMLAGLEPAAQRQLYLTVALAALVKGNTLASRFSANRALELAEDGTADQARAILYSAASLVVDVETLDQAATLIPRIRMDLLAPPDRELVEIVVATLNEIRSGTEQKPPSTAIPIAAMGGGEPGEVVEANPLMSRADEAIRAADALLAASAR